MSEPDSDAGTGAVLTEMEERLGYSIDDLARSFDRGGTWVARRLSLVETREGRAGEGNIASCERF